MCRLVWAAGRPPVCACVCAYVSVCMCVHACMCMCVRVHPCLYVCVCVHVSVCMFLCVSVCTHVHVRLCPCVHAYVCVYVCAGELADTAPPRHVCPVASPCPPRGRREDQRGVCFNPKEEAETGGKTSQTLGSLQSQQGGGQKEGPQKLLDKTRCPARALVCWCTAGLSARPVWPAAPGDAPSQGPATRPVGTGWHGAARQSSPGVPVAVSASPHPAQNWLRARPAELSGGKDVSQ